MPSFKSLGPMAWGAIGSLFYVLIYIVSLTNAFLRDDAEPQLVLAFLGFPASWIFFSVFDPLLVWLGPFGSLGRRIAEWNLLGIAGVVQYWIIGAVAALLIKGKRQE